MPSYAGALACRHDHRARRSPSSPSPTVQSESKMLLLSSALNLASSARELAPLASDLLDGESYDLSVCPLCYTHSMLFAVLMWRREKAMKWATRFGVHTAWKVLITDLGVDPAFVLRLAGFPADLFVREDASLSSADYFRLWRDLVESAGTD